MPKENIFAVSDPTLRLKSDPNRLLSKESTEMAKTLIMQDMLDALELEAQTSGESVSWAFYDDDYANFSKAQEQLVPQAGTRWPHLKIILGYVGSKHPNVEPSEVIALPKRPSELELPKASGQ
jgi:hypothetical protein